MRYSALLLLILLWLPTVCVAEEKAEVKSLESADGQKVEEKKQEVTEPKIEEMKEALVAKNMFEPKKKPQVSIMDKSDTNKKEDERNKLNRPFKLVGFSGTDKQKVAHLLFENPSERRSVKVGELIEIVEIKEIHNTYIRCLYGKEAVRIDVGETSDDALKRLKGYGVDYELTAISVSNKEAFALVLIDGRRWRVEVGDRLSDTTVVKIETGKVILRYDDGFEIAIEPTARQDNSDKL
ncbi:MAG: hypothetical protein JEZ07_11525 [Phycisphaerae bacterium]|nr:hypothetical protein [Phycisphaerae bacterium]